MSEGSGSNKEVDIPTDTETIGCDSLYHEARLHTGLTRESEFSIKIPIVGYEVMEQRAKFTVFKLRIEIGEAEDCYYVFRRYTDFVRLHSKIATEYPSLILPLPKKKWFGDNFNPHFIEDRIEGLQDFINGILPHETLLNKEIVRDFFCLDEPPTISENIEESKAFVGALEERVFRLKRQLKEQETAYERLKESHSVQIASKLRLTSFIQECTKQCSSCAARLSAIS